ncbi:MAG: Sec-independent protein translocase subunit TatA/TatB [Pirellulales bacterium]
MPALLGFLPSMGPLELIIVAMIILLLFGNRLPGLMRSLGQSITEFKRGVKEIESETDDAAKKK